MSNEVERGRHGEPLTEDWAALVRMLRDYGCHSLVEMVLVTHTEGLGNPKAALDELRLAAEWPGADW